MTEIEVHVEDRGEIVSAGSAYFTRTRGRVSTTFTYAQTYLARPDAQSIDPQLALVSGAQHRQGLFGSFADAAPDRWGRNLVTRLERENARAEGRLPRSLDDVDFLLGVSDATRQGALRFRLPGTDTFLGPHAEVPRTIALPALLRASDAATEDGRGKSAIKTLLDAGTGSLGGARPKAAVRLDDGGLGIAKFPHGSDEWNVMAWEATALDVAQSAGITTPDHRLVRVDDRHVLLLRRFDRAKEGRIGFVSAMTMLDAADGEDHDYFDLAERLAEVSAAARHDRNELFDRVALSVALGNTDDHLRNHGFLVARGGWRLSPAFDVNVNPDLAAPRRTSIAGAVGVADEPDGLLVLAPACGLTPDDARLRIANVIDAASRWRQAALANRITERELTLMADALEPRLDALRRAVT
ncbi:MAG: type II toxin-antitoxin system HipA family toxin [Actinomycetales bacterium]|nr:type II toxin-antitoxin system HipA family toxin [Actinomycetales bacterium]